MWFYFRGNKEAERGNREAGGEATERGKGRVRERGREREQRDGGLVAASLLCGSKPGRLTCMVSSRRFNPKCSK